VFNLQKRPSENLPERQRPVGRALTPEERKRLFDAAASNAECEHVYCAAVVAANTSMRPIEVKRLRRCDVDLVKRLEHVRRSKNETSHRVIPLNASAIEAAARMFERARISSGTRSQSTTSGQLAVGPVRRHPPDAEVGHSLSSAA
jgi:integrase